MALKLMKIDPATKELVAASQCAAPISADMVIHHRTLPQVHAAMEYLWCRHPTGIARWGVGLGGSLVSIQGRRNR